MKKLNRYKELLYDLIFPRRCPVCDEVVRFRRETVCEECGKRIKFVKEPSCMICGKPLQEEEEYCTDCERKKHAYTQGMAVFEYESIAGSLYRFKYGGRQEYADFFGKCMAERLKEKQRGWGVEAIVPVPVHASRKRKRGYNQAELLARVISEKTGIPMRNDLIIRTKKTLPQKQLNSRERQNS